MRVDRIRELIELLERSSIDELEIREWGRSIRLSKHARGGGPVAVGETGPQKPLGPAAHALVGEPDEAADADAGLIAIRSPMVGTFFQAPSPAAPAYVEPGSRVSVGQVVCIVEAMKHMNEIESEVSGEVVRILVENGRSVDFNQPLFLVRPDRV
ncbi:MAG: acetyl-CoA carboxylase biotin carboxyl carrier protein [Candidatus Eisenbacteria bacterium]